MGHRAGPERQSPLSGWGCLVGSAWAPGSGCGCWTPMLSSCVTWGGPCVLPTSSRVPGTKRVPGPAFLTAVSTRGRHLLRRMCPSFTLPLGQEVERGDVNLPLSPVASYCCRPRQSVLAGSRLHPRGPQLVHRRGGALLQLRVPHSTSKAHTCRRAGPLVSFRPWGGGPGANGSREKGVGQAGEGGSEGSGAAPCS